MTEKKKADADAATASCPYCGADASAADAGVVGVHQGDTTGEIVLAHAACWNRAGGGSAPA